MPLIALTITRCSVCASDDCDAPHILQIEVSGKTPLKLVVDHVISSGYLPRIDEGRASWVIKTAKPIGVIAQQWPTARYWVDANASVQDFFHFTRTLHFSYEVQKDPEILFQEYKEDSTGASNRGVPPDGNKLCVRDPAPAVDSLKAPTKLAIVLALAIIAICVSLFLYVGGPWSVAQASYFHKALRSADHRAVACAAIAEMHKRGTNTTVFQGASLRNLPRIITDLRPNKVVMGPNRVNIEFHGGFDHFGFVVRTNQGAWEMSSYSERGQQVLLMIPNGSQPIRSETNRTAMAEGAIRRAGK